MRVAPDAVPTQHQLSVKSLSAVRGRRSIFENLDLDARSGQVVQVLGPNGSGKSTLLRLICGLAVPDDGTIHWDAEDIHGAGQVDFRRANLYIGHKAGISGDQTALENLALFQRINAERAAMAPQAALERLSYNAAPDALCSKISAGQRQRVALAKLLAVKAALWLLDEPFTALDKNGKALLESLLATHCQQGGIAIVATHQPMNLKAIEVNDLHLN